jgi:hypothetical protein
MRDHLTDDWYLRLRCIIFVANRDCSCKYYTDGTTCVRCDILNAARDKWPTEYGDAIHAVITQNRGN